MSRIINEPSIKTPLIAALRELLEHRALWMYFLCDEVEKKGLKPQEYAPAAIRRCGEYQGGLLVKKGKKGKSLKGLKKALFGFFARRVFEMKILNCDDEHLDIDFSYCPLVKAWQKQGCSDERIEMMCKHAMCGDRGIGSCFDAELELRQTIAEGAQTCQLRYFKNTEGNKLQ